MPSNKVLSVGFVDVDWNLSTTIKIKKLKVTTVNVCINSVKCLYADHKRPFSATYTLIL